MNINDRYPIFNGDGEFERAHEELTEVRADEDPIDATWADPFMDYDKGRVKLSVVAEPPTIVKETTTYVRIGEQIVRDTTTEKITLDDAKEVVVTRQEMKQERTPQADGTYPKHWVGKEEPITLTGLARRIAFRRAMRLADEVVNVTSEEDPQAVGDAKQS